MSREVDDLTGRNFGRLTVIHRVPSPTRMPRWLCRCECGGEREAYRADLVRGQIKSCGCLRATTGKHVGDETYNLEMILGQMKYRCSNPNNHKYSRYGGRGIKVCNDWKHFKDFQQWAYANGYQSGLTIDRINNDGNYEPSNCRWITREENSSKAGVQKPN